MKKKNIIQSGYYAWKLYTRNGVYYADGRSNAAKAGKNSLGTRNYEEALKNLRILDMNIAAQKGNREAIAQMEHKAAADINLADGVAEYLAHIAQRQEIENRSPQTHARYKVALQKFQRYQELDGKVTSWGQISDDILEKYAVWLHKAIATKNTDISRYRRQQNGHSERTLKIELTIIKQAARYLSKKKRFSPVHELSYTVSVADFSNRYCYSAEEVAEILHVTSTPELMWLHDICLMLSKTGVRIGELRQMRWEDIVKNGDRCSIKLCNEAVDDGNSRRTKNRHDRLVPLHREIIERLDTYQHHEDGYIFHTPGSSRIYHGCVLKPLKNDVFPIAEKNLRDKGINSNVTKGCSHSFRHYFCSQCVKQDMPQQVLQLIMGHKNSGMVRHYLHLHDEDIHDIIEKVKL